MFQPIRRAVRGVLKRFGYDVIPFDPDLDYDDFDLRREDEELGILSRVGPYTMTSRSRVSALYRAVEYVVSNQIPGDIVECGVWRGGSMMAAALRLQQLGDAERHLYLFDTFEGMTDPRDVDADNRDRPAWEWMRSVAQGGKRALAQSLEEVRRNMESTGFSPDRIHYIQGPVEETLPGAAPPQIAILRLDTDWYESTYHELVHLYPRLSVGGILILDDYGYWKGARKAVDEYIAEHGLRLFLNRIDHSGRLAVKVDPGPEEAP